MKLYNYILENFALSGEAQRLVYNICSFTNDINTLYELLCGIGIDYVEIEKQIDKEDLQ